MAIETVGAGANASSSMRIAVVAPPWFPVPPPHYGGTERVCSLVSESLVELGHDVTLFAVADSTTSAMLESPTGVHDPERLRDMEVEAAHLAAVCERADEFDVIHDNSSVFGPLLLSCTDTPVVHTVHGAIDAYACDVYERVDHDVDLIALSESHAGQAPGLDWTEVIPNPVALDELLYAEEKDDYVLFLGRFSPEKGAPHAIESARRAGVRIVVAGPVHARDQEYFDAHVKPLMAQAHVEYVGPVGGRPRAELLAHARAVLLPVCWSEPFGLVATEAMASGTPVIAFPRGALVETVVDGETGFIVPDSEAMADAIDSVAEIDPAACREHAERDFAPLTIGRRYERALRRAAAARVNLKS